MKLLPAVALALAAGLAGSELTAIPAFATGSSTTDVTIAWKDDTFQQVVVSWQEAEPVANRIVLRKRGADTVYLTRTTTAEQPNSVEIPASSIRADNWSTGPDVPFDFTVSGGTGAEALSPGFDANTPNPPEAVSRTLAASGAMTVRWKSEARTDTTPNDPLDRTAPPTYQVSYTPAGTSASYPIGARSAATQATYTLRSAYSLNVAPYNEWGSQFERKLVTAEATRLTAKIPAWAVYNQSSQVTGTYTPAGERRQIVLQARNSSTSPWYTVSSSTFTGGKFSFPFGTGGSRQYRVVAPTVSFYAGALIAYGATTATVASTTQLGVSGFFSWTAIGTYMRNPTGVYVYPQVSTTATLQRWNGKAWTTVGPVQVKAGTGWGSIVATKVGRTAYRYYVPAAMSGGTRFAAAYTNTFVNDVGPGLDGPCRKSQGCPWA
ncbi:hypothetical protein [Kribbella endophytica]